jgi:hypothetical protein
VVAAVVDGEGPAFQRGQRAVEQRRAGDRARAVRQLVELAFQRTAPGGQPGRGLLRVLGQDGHRPRRRLASTASWKRAIFSAQNSTSGGSSETDANALTVIAWPALVVTTTMPPGNWPAARRKAA